MGVQEERLSQITRKEHAETYLDYRDNSYSVKKNMFKSLHLYILLAILGILFLFYGFYDDAPAFAAGGGYFLCIIKRDWEWIKAIKKNWSLTEEITDWAKVEQIANEEDI